jgi:hypothetical protein
VADALKPVVARWIEKIKCAWEHKKQQFQDDADECARFLDGPYDWLYMPRGGSAGFDVEELDLKAPSVRMTVNKTAELVQLFGPALYHRNPVRKVNPRKVVIPPPGMFGDVQTDPNAAMAMQQQMFQLQMSTDMDVARADLLEKYLNYTPTPLDLKTHARWAIDEALIKGMGVMWTQPYRPPGAVMSWVGTFYDSVDNLHLDPDAENIRDIKWCARKRVRPVWEVEREKGLAPGTLKPTPGLESYSTQAEVASDPENDYRRKQGRTADLITYWEVYSKMGMGGRLIGVPDEWKQKFDQLGDYVYLEVADGVNYPLNLPPPLCDILGGDDLALTQQVLPEIQQRTQWQTPYWADNAWPFTVFAFHWVPRRLWPMSHLKPGMGELKFINWAWSFLAAKVRIASRDFIAIVKAAGEDLKEKIKHGSDYTIIEVESSLNMAIDQIVKFLQHPGFNPEIYTIIEGVTQNFERRVGLTELMYGMSARQMRSAQEAQVKSDAINVRPDDMANQIEDCMTEVARKEAFAARWHLTGNDVVRVLGPVGATLWDQLLVQSDPAGVLHQLEYRIEANSARKPNKMMEAENMQQAMQQLFGPLMQYAMATADVNPLNALITDWAKSMDLEADKYLMQPPPPPMPPTPSEAPLPEGQPV